MKTTDNDVDKITNQREMKKILDAVKEDLKLKEKEKFKDCGFYDEKEKPLLNLDSKNINNPENTNEKDKEKSNEDSLNKEKKENLKTRTN